MDFALLSTVNPALVPADALIIAMTTQGLTTTGIALDEASTGQLSAALKAANFEGKLGQTVSLYRLNNISCPVIVVVGAGDSKDLNGRALQKVAAQAYKALNSKMQAAYSFLSELTVTDRAVTQVISDIARSTLEADYRFEQFKSKKSDANNLTMTLVVGDELANATGQSALAWGQAVATGQSFARDLGNLPPNICHPSYLAEQANALAKGQRKLSVEVLGEKDMEKLGMGAFLAVSKGSEQEGKLIVMNYTGGKKGEKPVVLVGKGITFDTGGISIKPAAGMDEMKFDMCGAASVLGVMKGILASKLPINVVCVVAAAENMPSGRATRPSDIVTTMSGQTVEILNTDAEGRLVLADGLAYAVENLNPDFLIDIATLTGSATLGLGKQYAAMYSRDLKFVKQLKEAGEQSGDRVWHMPLVDDYAIGLESDIADLSHIEHRGHFQGGSITAALFLEKFAGKTNWVHLDIAGTGRSDVDAGEFVKGGTGFGPRLLIDWIESL